ncbi:MAG: transposase [Tepidisphaeraceae bacterium]
MRDTPKPDRRSIRLKGYNYADDGEYFLTICVHERRLLFGEVRDGQMRLNEAGRMVEREWHALPQRFQGVELDQFIVMPNHVHGVLGLTGGGEPCVRPVSNAQATTGEDKLRPYGTLPDTVGRIVQAFKSITTNGYIDGVKRLGWPRFNRNVWQPNYYDHIIRNDHAMDLIREYVFTNPQRWAEDHENPSSQGSDDVRSFIRALETLRDEEGEHKVRPYGGQRG